MEWTFEDAQANLDDLLDQAMQDGPQHVRSESGDFVVLSENTYQLLSTRKRTLKELLINGPSLEGVDLSRDQSPAREFEW